jgi:hypothetical protein
MFLMNSAEFLILRLVLFQIIHLFKSRKIENGKLFEKSL